MSTGIGTLEAPRQSTWPAMVLALLVVVTLAVVATTIGATSGQPEGLSVGRHLVNTASELSGIHAGSVGGTTANTPSELSGGLAKWFDAGCGSLGCRNETAPNTAANTPTEMSGGLPAGQAAKIYARHQRF